MEPEKVKISQDSGLSSVGSESDSSPAETGSTKPCQLPAHVELPSGVDLSKSEVENPCTKAGSLPGTTSSGQDGEAGIKGGITKDQFDVHYLGNLVLDRRYTQPMLPWVMAEVKHRNDCTPIHLKVQAFTLQATHTDSSEIMFEHKLQSMSRFARTHADPTCFAYLTREGSDQPFACHVFQAVKETQVPELFKSIREATKEAVKEHNMTHLKEGKVVENMGDLMKAGHAFFEVLYTGKVPVSHKKAASTFIDDSVDKFQKEVQDDDVIVDQRQRHSSGNSVRSLPMTLEGNVNIMEDELKKLNNKSNGRTENKSSDTLSSASGENLESSGSTDRDSSTEMLGPQRKISDDFRINTHRTLENSRRRSQDNIKDGNDNKPGKSVNDSSRGLVQKDSENLMKDALLHQSFLPTNSSDNRVMLFQIGNDDVCVISTDQKTVMLSRNFKDISFCSQGIHHPEHFGFISREPVGNHFTCYVFQCAAESVVEEIMLTLKQAFSTAYNKCAKNHVVCELCPMHQLHKLCQAIEGLSADKASDIIKKRIEQLTEKDQSDIAAMIKSENPMTTQDINEVMMKALRIVCETRQGEHVHLSDTGKLQKKNEFNLMETSRKTAESRLDKVRRSLTNSFENLIKRKSSREEIDVRERSFTVGSDGNYNNTVSSQLNEHDSSASNTPDVSPCQSPVKKEFTERLPFGSRKEEQPLRKARSLTVDSPDNARHRKISMPPRVADLRHQEQSKHPPRGSQSPKLSPRVSAFEAASSPAMSPRPQKTSPSQLETPTKMTPRRRGSWRQQIFISVVTPAHSPKPLPIDESPEQVMPEVEKTPGKARDKPSSVSKGPPIDYRELWKKAILETVLLIRMEKENTKLQARQDEMETKRMKLDYEEITPCLKDVTKVWDSMIHTPNRATVKFDSNKLLDAVKAGVPRSRRGDVWKLLIEQHGHHNPGVQDAGPDNPVQYEDLLKQLTTHQHAILIDLGRTFPTHPYFSTQLGAGQLALFNLLKAYSLLDTEVGYCQGLSFVAGVLLMHMKEEYSFEILKYVMFKMGLRRQYRPDMVALQIQMYQLSRLLHDNYRDLYEHFETHEIAPTLYAAPWFLTLFASQYPLGFVARVFDLLFLQGAEVIFKVALMLLGTHKELLMQCDSFETIVEFLKTTLPSLGMIQMEHVINQVFALDISRQLQAYEVEYHVLQEEMVTSPQRGESDIIQKLEAANRHLKLQNTELLEQLQTAHGTKRSLELNIHNMQADVDKMKSHIGTLELERAALLQAVSRLRELIPEDCRERANIDIPTVVPSIKFTGSPVHSPLISRLTQSDRSNSNQPSRLVRGTRIDGSDKEVADITKPAHKPGPRINVERQPPRPMSN